MQAARLLIEAQEIIQSLQLQQTLEPSGGFVATGSNFLDVMVYHDLDLYVPMTNIINIFTSTGETVSTHGVMRVTFENEEHPTPPSDLFFQSKG